MNRFSAIFLLLGLLVTFARRWETVSVPTLYAEDGVVFLVDAFHYGVFSIFKPYAGYLHVIPRLGAYASSFLPIAWIPTAYLAFATFLLVATYSLCFHPRFPLRNRLLFFSMVILVANRGEVFFLLTNTIWFSGVALFFLLLVGPPSAAPRKVAWFVTLPLLSLTGIFSVLLAPVYLLTAVRRKTLAWSLTAAAVASGAMIQLVIFLKSASQTPAVTVPIYGVPWANTLAERTIVRWFFDAFWFPFPLAHWSGVGLLLLLFVGYVVWKGVRYRDWEIGQALFFWIALLLSAVTRIRDAEIIQHRWDADRYFFIPAILNAYLICRLMEKARPIERGALVFFSAVFMLTGLKYFSMESYDRRDWKTESACMGGPEDCSIPINPHGFNVYYSKDWKFIHPWQKHR